MAAVENISSGLAVKIADQKDGEKTSVLRRDSLQPSTILDVTNNLGMPTKGSTSVPPLMITAFWQESESSSSRTNCYRVLFSKSTNVRCQLTVSVTITKVSKYWPTTKLTSELYSCGDTMFLAEAGSLPQTLQDRMYDILSRQDGSHDNGNVVLALSDDDESLELVPQDSDQVSAPAPILVDTPHGSLTAAAYLETIGCKVYTEDEVRTISGFQPPKHFLSSIDGVLVEEVMCNRDPPSANFLNSIQAFHDMQSIPGLLSLKGVVLNESREVIRSYLLELPKTKCALLLDHLSVPDHTSWEERAMFAQKLIKIISQVHSKGYIVGTLQRRRLPVVVDTHGSLYLCRLETTLTPGSVQQMTDPPEYCAYWGSCDKSTSDHDAPKLTPEFDIYQLGLILWVIAQSWAEGTMATTVRRRFHGHSQPPYMDTEREIFVLPPLDAKVPEYYRSMVDACRRDDPSSRPTATQLPGLMPAFNMPAYSPSEDVIHEHLDVASYRACAPSTKECDTCGALLSGVFYHCSTCETGDYDVCSACLEAGKHCEGEEHLISELVIGCDYPVARKWVSCVKSEGGRDVLEV
ncbi:hypothetical protein FB567DRAFT_72668 [Paraphoma chrysanthemicola]|uniref:ZZ-type domain-containing protein n=1 Tax=Paraphoma chrysanthemicola TaxID=798071 RepID=A0A8K0VXL4_9PLEO|nr:hypothetical protein FB567DRAFT_72668 [Paraphoma chrysanthemicola]